MIQTDQEARVTRDSFQDPCQPCTWLERTDTWHFEGNSIRNLIHERTQSWNLSRINMFLSFSAMFIYHVRVYHSSPMNVFTRKAFRKKKRTSATVKCVGVDILDRILCGWDELARLSGYSGHSASPSRRVRALLLVAHCRPCTL